jgi:uncharacterized membrane protein
MKQQKDEECDCIDCFLMFQDQWIFLKRRTSILFTVSIDPFNVSNRCIKFGGKNKYGGYKVISSINKYHRRIVHWFYRNIKAPTLKEWKEMLRIFNLIDIPSHSLQLYNKNMKQLNEFIIVHRINNNYIKYTYNNKETKETTTVAVPIGIATLVPEMFMYNLNIYSKRIN